MDKYEKNYGLKPMTFEEEVNAPARIKATRIAKVNMIDRCNEMQTMLDTIKLRAKGIDEIDDGDYFKTVSKFFGLVTKAFEDIQEVSKFGYV